MLSYGFVQAIILTVALSYFSLSSFAEQYKNWQAAFLKQDYVAALRFLRPLAEQKDYAAEYQLGTMYSGGIGVPKDYATAAAWYRKSAEQGNAVAQIALGELYRQGKGLPKDYVQAYKWFNLTAAQFPTVLNAERDKLEESMTPSQVAEGQKLSRDWKPMLPK